MANIDSFKPRDDSARWDQMGLPKKRISVDGDFESPEEPDCPLRVTNELVGYFPDATETGPGPKRAYRWPGPTTRRD